MKKTKVCILQNGLARGGTDTFVVNLCKAINKDKYELTVVNPSNKPEGLVREPDVLETGAKIVHTHPLTSWWGKLKHFILLYRFLQKEKFDVFQTNIDLFNGPNLLIAWLARVPIRCCHSHNTRQQKELVSGKTPLIDLYQKAMKWMCWHFSNRRCGCSEEAMDFLYGKNPWRDSLYPSIIYNGIELEKFQVSCQMVEDIKQKLGLSRQHLILTVGQIIPQKNPLFIAQIMKEICSVRDDIDLVWVGIGNMQSEVGKLFRDWKIQHRVHFLGQRTDVPDIMKCCNVFLLPSVFEGLGIVLIEAQAAGLPCVASDQVPMLADCGAVKYISLSSPISKWISFIIDLIDKKIEFQVDNNKLQSFSVLYMAEQMEKVFNP